MKYSSRNDLIGILILTATVFFLYGCATKKETTQPDTKPAPVEVKTEDQTKSAPAHSPKEQPKPTPTPSPPPPSPPPPSKAPEVSQSPTQHTTEIALGLVNLRQGPSMNDKIIRVLKKGTKVKVLEEKTGWLHVQLEDGTEGWVAKAMTTEGVQPKSP